MPDREKTIKGLTDIGRWIAGHVGFEMARNFLHTIDDAVALLKEQEPVKPQIDAFGHPCCPKCKILLYQTWKFCPHCGQAVKCG